jgi:hypothetical protein
MILVDSNILMYAAGAEHPNKAVAVGFLGRVAAGEVEAALDAEVLQEIIHRYQALNRWADGRTVYRLARDLVEADGSISARDAVHAAVVQVYSLDGICSFDRDFERIPDCARIGLG